MGLSTGSPTDCASGFGSAGTCKCSGFSNGGPLLPNLEVVDRVRIEQLSDFGTPAFVGDKVVASERERDGVTAAELSKAVEMVVDGQTYYERAYSNESSRGNNNFLSRVAVRGGRLYVMTLKARVDDAGLRFPAFEFQMAARDDAPVKVRSTLSQQQIFVH